VQVRDGRGVGFAEWGDPAGPPVLAFHGGPGSRLMATGCERAAGELGLRLVCLERPGFGLSDSAPSRTLIGWADDVADATRALGIEQFVVVGVSAGAPYALACGARLPELVRRVGVDEVQVLVHAADLKDPQDRCGWAGDLQLPALPQGALVQVDHHPQTGGVDERRRDRSRALKN